MTIQTQNDYQIEGNSAIPKELKDLFPIIGNLTYNKLGKEVLARHNEKFKGKKGIEDKTPYEEGQPISFSNVPRVLSYNQIMRELTEGRIRGLDIVEFVRYWDLIPNKSSTYADSVSISLFPNEGPNEDLRKKVLGIIGKPATLVPLLVSGLGVDPADNKYGFTFIKTDYLDKAEAPILKEDGRISHDPKKGFSKSEEGVQIWTPSDQSGLCRACRFGGDGLDFNYDNLLVSNENGRVQVIQDPVGSEKNLDALVAKFEAERNQALEQARRYKGAIKLAKTGKL